jgi:putative flippase GtrA
VVEVLTKALLGALFRFGIGGLLSSGVAVGMTAILHELASLSQPLAAALGLVSAMVVNFLMLRYFIFRGTHLPVVRQSLTFLASSGLFRGLEYVAFLLVNAISGTHYLIALVLVLGGSFILKFIVYEGWVFARQGPGAPDDANQRGGMP